jgi:predicted nucleic acid-binding protein
MRVVDPTPLESNVCRDPDDDMVLATALPAPAARDRASVAALTAERSVP